MTGLDKQVAEAQGWKWNPHHEWWVYDDSGKRRNVLLEECYTPSTDLNQAVAFAEWVLEQDLHLQWFDLLYCPSVKKWEAGFYDDRLPDNPIEYGDHENVRADAPTAAEAVCLAVLKALGERSA